MTEPIQAYPLQWPIGWRRATSRKSAAFKSYKRQLCVMDGVERVLRELEALGARNRDNIVISTNVPTRLDGLPRSNVGEPVDPGAAAYWVTRGLKQPRCMAIDRYDRVADNLAAIAATLDAMRAIERHGGAEILDRAFSGFVALPSPEQPWQTLGLDTSNPTPEQIEEAYRRLAMQHHPDRGGDAQQMARINAARDALRERLQLE